MRCTARGEISGPGDHIDDAIHRIGAPQRGTRSADDLDPRHVAQQHILRIQIDAGEQR